MSFTDSLICFALSSICKANSLINFLEVECSLLRLLEMSINANIVVSLLLFVYFVYIIASSVCCVFLFTSLPFFMLVFVVILSSSTICKQVCLLPSFILVTFVYNFNVKQCKSNIPASRFFETACSEANSVY